MRSRKAAKKGTPEERVIDLWNQEVFLIKKRFPDADGKISAIQRDHEERSGAPFIPTEEATEDLRKIFFGPNAT